MAPNLFTQFFTNTEIAASGKLPITEMQNKRALYGDNFNTLIVLNTSSVNIKIYLDDKAFTVVNANNGSITFDWQDGVIYNSVLLENLSGAAVASASTIFVTYGRTGKVENGKSSG